VTVSKGKHIRSGGDMREDEEDWRDGETLVRAEVG
jgi:hypothetical protein